MKETNTRDQELRNFDIGFFLINLGQTIFFSLGGARGVMVIVVGNEHGDSSSNPGQD